MSMLLVFEVSGQRFAVDTAWAAEVVVPRSLARLPGAPAGVRGLFNFRGEVVAAIDLDTLLGRSTAATTRAWAVVLKQQFTEAVVLADAVETVEMVSEVQPVVPTLAPDLADVAAGTVRLGGRLVVVLDIPRLLRACASGGPWQLPRQEETNP